MCSIGAPDANSKYINTDHMDWNLFEKIILEAEKYQCPSLNPQGINEPLLINNFEDYVKFASQHGFVDIMINTNATLLSEDRAKKLLDSGLTRIRFSLDAATKETYEKIRIGANYDKVMKNIETFLKIRESGNYELPVVGVNFCNMKTNEGEKDQFIEMWKDKVDFVAIQEFTPPELDGNYTHFHPSNSRYRDDMENGFNCQQPWQRLFIHNTGEVSPCCTFFSSELSVGNVKNDSLYDLWNGVSMTSLRKLHKDGKYAENEWCKKCVNATCGKNIDLVDIKK